MGILFNNHKKINYKNRVRWGSKDSHPRVLKAITTHQHLTPLKTLTHENRQFLLTLGLKLRRRRCHRPRRH